MNFRVLAVLAVTVVAVLTPQSTFAQPSGWYIGPLAGQYQRLAFQTRRKPPRKRTCGCARAGAALRSRARLPRYLLPIEAEDVNGKNEPENDVHDRARRKGDKGFATC